MRDELKTQVSRLGVTTLYITHDQVESMAMADRIAIMNLGEIQQVGTPLEIYYNPRNEFVAGFIGEPPMNFTLCEYRMDGGQHLIESPSFRFTLDAVCADRFKNFTGSKKLKLGVRPEDVRVSVEKAANSFPMEVDFVEPQGDRTILSLKLKSGEILMAQVLGDMRPKVGDFLHVQFDQRHVHFFDLETGLNILYAE
jgi:multiple sugar transport system ATP-binding protein